MAPPRPLRPPLASTLPALPLLLAALLLIAAVPAQAAQTAPSDCTEGQSAPDGFRLAGMRHLSLRDGAAAAACFRRALRSARLAPGERAPLQRQLAVALQLAGRLEQAARHAELAMKTAQQLDDDAELALALELSADLALVRGDMKLARQQMEAAVALEDAGSHESRLLKLGLLYERLGMLPVALATYKAAEDANIQAAPHTAVPITRCLLRLGGNAEAEDLASRWLNLPKIEQAQFYPKLLLLRATARLNLGKVTAAQEDLQLATTKVPATDVELRVLQAMVAARQFGGAAVSNRTSDDAATAANAIALLVTDVLQAQHPPAGQSPLEQLLNDPLPLPPLSIDEAVRLNVDAAKLSKLARAHSDVWAQAVSGERQELEQRHALLGWRHGDLSPLRVAIVSSQLADTVQGRGLAALLAAQPRPAWVHLTLISAGRPPAAGTADAAVLAQLKAQADVVEDAHGWSAHQLATYLLQHFVHIAIYIDDPHAPSLLQGVMQLRPSPLQVAWGSLWPAPAGSNLASFLACSSNGCAPRPLRKTLVERPALLSPDVAFWWLQKPDAESAVGGAGSAKLRRGMGLPTTNATEKQFVFCSPVGADQIDTGSVSAWLDILEQVPAARLVLRPQVAKASQSGKLLVAAAKARKLSKRVHTWKNMPSHPWGPASSVCHAVLAPLSRPSEQTLMAVAAGLPVVALGGSTLAARQLAGFLHDVGLADGVAQSTEEYVRKACGWATDPELYAKAHAAAGVFTKGEGYAAFWDMATRSHNFWHAVQQMWEQASSSITEPLDLSQSSSFAEPNKAEPGPEHQLMAVENEFQARLPADGDDEGPNTRSTAKDDADGVYVITPIAFH